MFAFEEFIEELQQPQSVYQSITWQLTPQGLLVDGNIETSGGQPVTVGKVWNKFKDPIIQQAGVFNVPVELIVATICTESSGNPNALRREPGFISATTTPHRVSAGLMQTLLSTAQSTLERKNLTLDWLFHPENSIEAGTAYIRLQANKTHFDPPKVACAYNAGGVYHNTSPSNRWRMRQYPVGTSEHADRFVKWFNDCFLLFCDIEVPDCSFYKVLNS